MNLNTTKSNLLYVVQSVYRASQARNILPLLGSINFKTKGDFLVATSTDMELTIQCKTPVSVLQEGETCLPARQFLDITRCLPDTVVNIKKNEENNGVRIFYNDSEININGFPAEQFPTMPEILDHTAFELPQGLLKEMIKKTIYAVSMDKTRPLFTGVLFEGQDQKLRLVATDTHRLALYETSVQVEQTENVIVPGSALSELNRLMRQDEESVELKIGKNHISFQTKDFLLISRLLAGQFPAYRQIIPVNFLASLVIDTQELIDAVTRASLLISEEAPVLRFNFDHQRSLISVNTSTGWIKEKVSADYNGEAMEVFFNARYLIEILRAITTKEVLVKLTGPLSAAIIQPVGREDYLSLLLPARPKSE